MNRQAHKKAGVARLGLHSNLAAMPLAYDAVGDVQAQAGSLSHRFGGKERLKG